MVCALGLAATTASPAAGAEASTPRSPNGDGVALSPRTETLWEEREKEGEEGEVDGGGETGGVGGASRVGFSARPGGEGEPRGTERGAEGGARGGAVRATRRQR